MSLASALAQHGGVLTRQEWRRYGYYPTTRTIETVFGTWAQAWDEVGVSYKSRRPQRILAAIREVDQTHGFLTTTDWRALHLHPDVVTIYRAFPQLTWRQVWAKAIKEAG